MIVKRSEHGLGHLLNPYKPGSDGREWITDAYQILLHEPELLLGRGGPAWFDLPALTQVTLASKEVARAFTAYNGERPWREQIKPFNFILHAHIDPFGYPPGVDPAHFRLIAPYEREPAGWLQLPWIDLYSGVRHEVTTDPHDHRAHLVRLKTYRDVLALYAIHPEPKSLDADGNPCNRRSPPGLLSRRPITMLTISLIGKESNRLEETIAGLIGSLDDTLATYSGTSDNAWTTLVLPAVNDFPTRQVAARANLDTRTLQRIKNHAITTPHARNRNILALVTAQLAAEKLAGWGLAVPRGPLEQIAAYLDHRDAHLQSKRCVVCRRKLIGRQRFYCSDNCRSTAYKRRVRNEEQGPS